MKSKHLLFLPLLIVILLAAMPQSPKIIRGPYINVVTPTSVVIRWRTDVPSNSKVFFGTDLKTVSNEASLEETTTEHEVQVASLQPSTKYFYSFGSGTEMSTPTENHYFKTSPEFGSTKPVRIWALGDFGNSSKNQHDCMVSIMNATKDHRPDAWIWLGDNAYSKGKDDEFQKHVFNVYSESFFCNTSLYPSPGNHDYGGQIDTLDIPYFKIFSMPTKGEAGGIPSGSESYYSVDYGNVHLVSLDSYGKLQDGYRMFDTLSSQIQWLKKDLAANKQPWTVIYFHHPPYTKGSHDSDKEDLLVKIRENVVPIFEKYKVDLVLAGHSHVYERTHPIRGHYGLAATFDPKKHIFEKVSSVNNYIVNGGKQGIIYVVNGSGGQVGGQKEGYPMKSAIYSNNTIGGSMLLDFSGNRLDAKWVCADGVVRDQFSITKEIQLVDAAKNKKKN